MPDRLAATYFDGRTSRRQDVRLTAAASLMLFHDDQVVDQWPLDEVRRADASPGLLRLRRNLGQDLARLEFPDDEAGRALLRFFPKLDIAEASVHSVAKIVAWSLGAGLSILALAWFGVPLAADRLAPLVPVALENRLGETVERQALLAFGKKTCEGKDGAAALNKLLAKLQGQAGLPQARPAQVLDSPIPNAFALPGNRVFLLRGLIDKTQNPDELAGVMAHELGHVRNRDGLRQLIREGGNSFLIGLLFGDVSGSGAAIFASRALFGAAYSREAESRADAVAVEVLRGLGRSPAPLGQLLVRVTGESDKRAGPFSILASHPMSAERLAAMQAAKVETSGPELLDAQEWRALKAICGKPDGAGKAPVAPGITR
jgi:Zn-dependent protease with chaperone function